MSSGAEQESEILLGNKQLLAVFAVVAVLLAIAFTGGYMLGKSSAEKKVVADGSHDGSDTALVPRSVTPDDMVASKPEPKETKPETPPLMQDEPKDDAKSVYAPSPINRHGFAKDLVAKEPVFKEKERDREPVLGARASLESTPKAGLTFVQVAALTHTEAAATAEVLRKQNFQARIAPKPGSSTVYRVLVGPTRDAGEITATRDALRKIGFRDVIVQRY